MSNIEYISQINLFFEYIRTMFRVLEQEGWLSWTLN